MTKYRSGLMLVVLAGLVSLSGASCASMRRPIDDFANLPPALPPQPTLDQVIQVVNGNNSQIRNFFSPEATLSVTGFPTLQATVAFERPQRFRIRAGTGMLGQELDVGSNDELFWFWAKRTQPPAVYFCRHAQFASSPVRQSLLIDPYWLIEALGVGEIDPTQQHQGPWLRSDGRLEIRTVRNGPDGPSTKITVLDRLHGLLLEQHVINGQNQILASSTTSEHRRDPLSGFATPTVIDIRIPTQKTALRLNLGNVQVNRTLANPDQLWAMPTGQGMTPIDLCNPNQPAAPPGPAAQPQAVSRRYDLRYPAKPGGRW